MGKTGYTIICENCGKESYQTQTQYNRAKHHFCCNDCSIKFRSKKAKCIRQCEYCGKDMELNNSSNQRFCSIDCQNKWQRTLVGESNPRYNRIIKPCESCGKDILMIEGNIKRFKHHFCCDDCRRYWYNNVCSQTEERKEISRINAVKYLESNTIITSTKPQKIINTLLNEMQINFINEYNCTYYAIDNYLYDYNLMIEVMGDFWHCNPIKYRDIKQDIQRKRIPKDKAKHTYIKNLYNIEILYLWEDDIYNNIDVCRLLILEYIKSQGVLKNYHSFNYQTEENKFKLKENLTKSFFDKRDINVNA